MRTLRLSDRARRVLGMAIASVWVFHGLYSKILLGVPRHRQIVGRVLGEGIAGPATLTVGFLEVLLGIWILTGRKRTVCALVQTGAIFGMNTLEILLAKDLLISATGMVALNMIFLAVVWFWAKSPAEK